jgi:uncharacterized protein (DUF433 family)
MIERIAVDPKVHFGKPCVAGTRITVQGVLELLDEGLSFDEIIRDYYPDLAVKDVHACIRYAIALVAAEDIHLTAVPA